LDNIGPLLRYDVVSGATYPLWERSIERSIRADGSSGFLVPYHDYLQPTGDPAGELRRRELAEDIAVVPERANIAAYSYAESSPVPTSPCRRASGHCRSSASYTPMASRPSRGNSAGTDSTRRSPDSDATVARSRERVPCLRRWV
jgi:hypothetical protein